MAKFLFLAQGHVCGKKVCAKLKSTSRRGRGEVAILGFRTSPFSTTVMQLGSFQNHVGCMNLWKRIYKQSSSKSILKPYASSIILARYMSSCSDGPTRTFQKKNECNLLARWKRLMGLITHIAPDSKSTWKIQMNVHYRYLGPESKVIIILLSITSKQVCTWLSV